jgi:hypothetical protein
MRVIVFVKATKDSEAGRPPSPELLAEMGRFNEELSRAGVLVDAAGLKESAKSARVRFAGAQRLVIDGPFAETKELVAGYWLWEVGSLAEAVEWVKRCPNPHPGQTTEVEIRPLKDASDFES